MKEQPRLAQPLVFAHRHQVALRHGQAVLKDHDQRVVPGELRTGLGWTASERLLVQAHHGVRYLEHRAAVGRSRTRCPGFSCDCLSASALPSASGLDRRLIPCHREHPRSRRQKSRSARGAIQEGALESNHGPVPLSAPRQRLARWPAISTIRPLAGRLAQLVERLPYKQEVTGSSPVPPIVHLQGFSPRRNHWPSARPNFVRTLPPRRATRIASSALIRGASSSSSMTWPYVRRHTAVE